MGSRIGCGFLSRARACSAAVLFVKALAWAQASGPRLLRVRHFSGNSKVFLLFGVDLASTPFSDYGPTMRCMGVVLIARAITVYPLRAGGSALASSMCFGGAAARRFGLALALSLPQSLPMREAIVVATFGVVAFSIVAQGLTMPLLLRAFGFLQSKS